MNRSRRDPNCSTTARIKPALLALAVPLRHEAEPYPDGFRARVAGRQKRALGDHFALRNFGVNLLRLPPGAMSALRHAHARQDEFVYVLQGALTLIDDSGRTTLTRGMCVGFPAGTGNAHHFVNETRLDAIALEVGDRSPGDEVRYPDDDLEVTMVDGRWRMTHADGTPY